MQITHSLRLVNCWTSRRDHLFLGLIPMLGRRNIDARC